VIAFIRRFVIAFREAWRDTKAAWGHDEGDR
jgi:hypothetical protein